VARHCAVLLTACALRTLLGATGQPELYTLHSVLLHSGSKEGGRYYAYINTNTAAAAAAAAAANAGEWAKFEDELVTTVSPEEVSSTTL
jgi:ubiquitin C-terminal hydrolase